MPRLLAVLVVALAAFGVGLGGSVGAADRTVLTLGTATPGGGFPVYGEALAAVVSAPETAPRWSSTDAWRRSGAAAWAGPGSRPWPAAADASSRRPRKRSVASRPSTRFSER